MYGVLFTQSCDNDMYGVLLFDKEAKAKLAYRVMLGMDELSSLDQNLETIFDSSDYDEIPEVENVFEEIITVEISEETKLVKLINFHEKYDIPNVE